MTSIEFIESKIKHFKKILETGKSPINKPIDKAMLEIFKNRIEEYENVLKELKALEIIKNKHISVWRFRNIVFGYEQKQNGNNVNDTYEYYTHCFGYYHEGFEFELLTEEEFDLLKETLKP